MNSLLATGVAFGLLAFTPHSIFPKNLTNPNPSPFRPDLIKLMSDKDSDKSVQLALGYHDREGLWNWSDGTIEPSYNSYDGYY